MVQSFISFDSVRLHLMWVAKSDLVVYVWLWLGIMYMYIYICMYNVGIRRSEATNKASLMLKYYIYRDTKKAYTHTYIGTKKEALFFLLITFVC